MTLRRVPGEVGTVLLHKHTWARAPSGGTRVKHTLSDRDSAQGLERHEGETQRTRVSAEGGVSLGGAEQGRREETPGRVHLRVETET